MQQHDERTLAGIDVVETDVAQVGVAVGYARLVARHLDISAQCWGRGDQGARPQRRSGAGPGGRDRQPRSLVLRSEPTLPAKYYDMTYVERAHATLAR